MSAIIDNNYLVGPPAAIFPANRTFAQDLKEVGPKLNPHKPKCYFNYAYRNASWDGMRSNIPNGSLLEKSGAVTVGDDGPAYGVTVYNIPVGTISFIRRYLTDRKDKIVTGFDKIECLLDPGQGPHPEILSRQML